MKEIENIVAMYEKIVREGGHNCGAAIEMRKLIQGFIAKLEA